MTHFAPRAALLALALTLFVAAPASAQDQQGPLSPVEGIWSYGGGQIAIERQEDGSFLGTVIRRTTISCPNRIGERLWIDIRLQNDGSYWGEHQFFRPEGGCEIVPERGNVAFRIINPAGQTYLRVCLASPGTDAQPKIAEDGTATDADAGCRDATFLDLLPKKNAKLNEILRMPKGRNGCIKRKRFGIGLKHPVGDALERATVKLNGQKLKTFVRRNKLKTAIDLRQLRSGRYKLKIVARTVRGNRIKGTKRFRNCS